MTKRIALIAHDKKKAEIAKFASEYKDTLRNHQLFATGTTGEIISQATGLNIERFLSGPLGGDLQIGAKIACGEMDLVIFFRDPLTAQPHEPDITALLRICDVQDVAVVTNRAGAELVITCL